MEKSKDDKKNEGLKRETELVKKMAEQYTEKELTCLLILKINKLSKVMLNSFNE